ncbi:MAG: hypothetical protein M3275_02200 [Thermoproteota archaeon]|nr:hypothetical protein [Thermoproteota archaeon]
MATVMLPMVVDNNNNTLHNNKVKQKNMSLWQERKDIVNSTASWQSYFVYHINICDKTFNYDTARMFLVLSLFEHALAYLKS